MVVEVIVEGCPSTALQEFDDASIGELVDTIGANYPKATISFKGVWSSTEIGIMKEYLPFGSLAAVFRYANGETYPFFVRKLDTMGVPFNFYASKNRLMVENLRFIHTGVVSERDATPSMLGLEHNSVIDVVIR